jgi:GT2 family glycosyltransferase
MNKIEISILIVHYQTPDLLLNCVSSLWNNSAAVTIEVIVVDNESNDDSKKQILSSFPQTKWIDAGYNSGFARGNNLGIRNSNGEYVLLLNPDSFITDDFLNKMLGFYKQKDAKHRLGLLGCRIISSVDQSLLVGTGMSFPGIIKYVKANPLFIKLFRGLVNNKKYKPEEMHYKNHEVDFVSGACVMIKRSKIDQFDLYLDEDFFLYYEDVELSFRTQKKGLVNYFTADVEVYHENSASTAKNSTRNNIILVSEILFYFKTISIINWCFLKQLVRLNFCLNRLLLKRKNQFELLTEETEQFKIRKKYFTRIEKEFKRKPCSAQNFLTYVE